MVRLMCESAIENGVASPKSPKKTGMARLARVVGTIGLPGRAWEKWVVPKVGFEPTRGCPHTALNRARLPISPLRHEVG